MEAGAAQRHLVVNTLVTDWDDHEANAISDVVFVLQGHSGWAIQLVGRYQDTLNHDDGEWRFHHRAAEFVT
jgi:SnoaL-like domain